MLLSVLAFAACKKEEAVTAEKPETKDTTEKIIEIKTSYGTMYMWLYKETPLHRANFLALADTNFFDGTTFHRIIKDFMIQGGDPNSKDTIATNDGQGGPGYTIPAEIDATKLKHARGEVGAARLGDAQNPTRASSGSQFYICHSTSGTQHLNGLYTVFGKIISGIEVVDSIAIKPKDANNRPLVNIPMDINVVEKTRAQLRADYHFEAN
ncbi:MAG: peptidylprolyl isomerase [Bacteroidia bacterium]|nr:peptidylprolyl isomerase [Bacteroidia bacterium]